MFERQAVKRYCFEEKPQVEIPLTHPGRLRDFIFVAEQTLALASLGGLKNPSFERQVVLNFNKAYLAWRGAMVAKRLKGQKYQVPGPTRRGDVR